MNVHFSVLLKKWNSYIPKKEKCLYGYHLHVQPGWQVSVPTSHSCDLADEIMILASNTILCFTPKTKLELFLLCSDWLLYPPYPALDLIHFQHKLFDQLVLMLVSQEWQAEQVLMPMFPLGIHIFSPSSVTFIVTSKHNQQQKQLFRRDCIS